MEENAKYYRKVIGSIGISMLFFLLFVNTFSFLISDSTVIEIMFGDLYFSRTEYAIYQLLYAAGYLASFMLPVAILKTFLKKRAVIYRPMYTTVRFPKIALWAIPLGIAVIFSAAYINRAFTDIFHINDLINTFVGSSVQHEGFELVLDFITICLVPGFCEEFLFRGAILTNCIPFGRSNAIMISALLFAMMHQNPQQFFFAFVAGIFLGILYEKSKSIWPGVLLHTLNNFVDLTQGVMAENSNQAITAIGLTTALEVAVLLLGVVALLVLLPRCFAKKKDYSEGVFGCSLEAADEYAEYPLSAKEMRKLFWTPSMIAFVVICALETLLIVGLAVMYGTIG